MSDFKLNQLRAAAGIDKKVIGRGIGSGCGKTSTRGHKGGKSRSGSGKESWFEGGQMPLYRRMPKRGFSSMKDKSGICVVNLRSIQELCDSGVISSGQNIDIAILKQLGLVRQNCDFVRLLGDGILKVALKFSVGYATSSAISCVEGVGGKVEIV